MADIFISYARADRERVEALAATLEAHGHAVWWDRQILGGDDFVANIERELNAARAVIVAWSSVGSTSHWVRDEAQVAAVADPYGALMRHLSAPVLELQPEEMSPYEALIRCFVYRMRINRADPLITRRVLEQAVERAPNSANLWAVRACIERWKAVWPGSMEDFRLNNKRWFYAQPEYLQRFEDDLRTAGMVFL